MVGTVVIGGGAAGIAAARRLHDAGHDVLLVEAKDRLGGRAYSVRLTLPPPTGGATGGENERSSDRNIPPSAGATDGVTVDYGCGWLHSARRNPWTAIADRNGFTVDRSSPNWGEQWRDLGFPPADQNAADAAYERWHDAALAAVDGPDRPLSAFVAPDDPWRPIIDAISGFANGAPLDRVSLHDWAAYERAAGDDNWVVREGYGTLVASQATGVPVRLGTPVARIDRRGRRLGLETAAGTIDADRAIVCVPTTVLARGDLRFDPPLPDKQAAAGALPLGIADKAFLHVAGALPWDAQAHLRGDPYRACTASHRLSPFGWPIVESFLGGACAEALEDADAAAFAIDELVGLLGSDWRPRFTPLAVTRWAHEPFVHGSYSHARIGQAGARARLAEPVDDRLFFAGEACHPYDFSTAHGAYETGIAAADAVLAAARPPG